MESADTAAGAGAAATTSSDGKGGQGSSTAGSSTAGSSTAGGAGGAAGSEECPLLPEIVDEDLEVGPGCVRLERTSVDQGATLTITPGTIVLVEPAGYLNVGPSGDNSAVVAKGTEQQPITFSSVAEEPQAGDWQCVRIGAGSSASELAYVTLEFGGQPCEATGADYEAALDLAGAARIRKVTITDSQTHAVLIQHKAALRTFEDNTFARNERPSILVHASELLTLGTGNSFESEGDTIDVDTTFTLDDTGVWTNQGVPYRLGGGLSILPPGDVTVEAGTVIQVDGASIDVLADAAFQIAGTEAEPVVFTSAQASPAAGDWGCVLYSPASATPHIDYAVFEYAGNGQGCTGANYKTALFVPPAANVTNSVFRELAGAAIFTPGECDIAQWCSNTFEAPSNAELVCDVGQNETACP